MQGGGVRVFIRVIVSRGLKTAACTKRMGNVENDWAGLGYHKKDWCVVCPNHELKSMSAFMKTFTCFDALVRVTGLGES